MKPRFTPDGVEVQSFDEIWNELAAGYRAIYGQDINLDPDSPDGQRIGIEAKHRADVQAFGLRLYNQLDPELAEGESLDKLIKFAGISRRLPSRSQVDVTITTDRNLTLEAGYTVRDDLGQNWKTQSPVNLTTGANTVTLFSEVFGAIEADAGTVETPVTVVIGVTSVTNPAAATVGRDEESDAALRIRRRRSTENPAYSTVGGLTARLADLPGVTDLQVYENDQDTTDVVRNIPPHTIWVVIEGGEVDAIVETITKHKTAGTGRKGSIVGTYLEEIPLATGFTITIQHEQRFDRPTLVPIEVRLTATRRNPAEPFDIALMKDTLAALRFRINQAVDAAELYGPLYAAVPGFIATDLEISLDGVTWTDETLIPAADERFTIDAADVNITEVIP